MSPFWPSTSISVRSVIFSVTPHFFGGQPQPYALHGGDDQWIQRGFPLSPISLTIVATVIVWAFKSTASIWSYDCLYSSGFVFRGLPAWLFGTTAYNSTKASRSVVVIEHLSWMDLRANGKEGCIWSILPLAGTMSKRDSSQYSAIQIHFTTAQMFIPQC